LGIVDLLAVLPYYIELIVSYTCQADLAVLMVVRMTRLFKFVNTWHYTKLKSVPYAFMGALSTKIVSLVVSNMIVVIWLCIVATAIFYAETSEEYFDYRYHLWFYNSYYGGGAPSLYMSIVHSIWWSVVTVSTTGLGEVVPITPAGRTVTCFVTLISVFVVVMPLSILGNKIASTLRQFDDEQNLAKMQKQLRQLNDQNEPFVDSFNHHYHIHQRAFVDTQQSVQSLSDQLAASKEQLDKLIILHKSWVYYCENHPTDTEFYIPLSRFESVVSENEEKK